jgi:hypothetical protein
VSTAWHRNVRGDALPAARQPAREQPPPVEHHHQARPTPADDALRRGYHE